MRIETLRYCNICSADGSRANMPINTWINCIVIALFPTPPPPTTTSLYVCAWFGLSPGRDILISLNINYLNDNYYKNSLISLIYDNQQHSLTTRRWLKYFWDRKAERNKWERDKIERLRSVITYFGLTIHFCNCNTWIFEILTKFQYVN